MAAPSAPPAPIVGSARRGSLRFMLRGRTDVGGGASAAGSGSEAAAARALAAAAAPPLPSAHAPASAAAGPAQRLQCVRDSASTAVTCQDTALTDLGGMVSGRRSFCGANRVLEAAAKSAYASVRSAAEEVTDADLARAGLAGEAARQHAERSDAKAEAKRRAGDGVGGGGGGGGGGCEDGKGKKKRRW
jgi:hypothetical protein